MGYAVGAGNGGAGVVDDGQELLPWVSGIRESEELPYTLKPLSGHRAAFLFIWKEGANAKGDMQLLLRHI